MILEFWLGLGIGFVGATLLSWTLLLSGARRLVIRAIQRGYFRFAGDTYIVRPDL